MIKPNLPELEGLMGRELKTLRSIRDAAIQLIARGARNVIVSMGKYGAIYTDGKRTLFAPAVQVEACSTVGAGEGVFSTFAAGAAQAESVSAESPRALRSALRWASSSCCIASAFGGMAHPAWAAAPRQSTVDAAMAARRIRKSMTFPHRSAPSTNPRAVGPESGRMWHK